MSTGKGRAKWLLIVSLLVAGVLGRGPGGPLPLEAAKCGMSMFFKCGTAIVCIEYEDEWGQWCWIADLYLYPFVLDAW